MAKRILKEKKVITCNGGKGIPVRMKLSHYLRCYEERHGIRLSPELVEQEALKEGIILDFSGETSGTYLGPGGEQKKK